MYELLKQQSELLELHSIPSADLRNLIEHATTKNSSFQLQDALLVAGLVNEEELAATGAIPWEQTQLYAEMKQHDSATTFQTQHGGSCISLHAPSRHRLFIKYCKDCVGMMSFVREWNEDVEKAFKNVLQEKQNIELKRTVNRLNDLLITQGKEMVSMKAELDSVNSANAWFRRWHDTSAEDVKARAERLRAQLHMERNRAGMTREDLTAEKIRSHEALCKRQEIISSLRSTLETSTTSYEEQLCEINLKYAAAMDVIEKQKEDIAKMENQVSKAEIAVEIHKKEISALEKNKLALLDLITEKDNIYAEYKSSTDEKIASLEDKVNCMTNDYEQLQKQNDELNDALCGYRDRLQELEKRPPITVEVPVAEKKDEDSVQSIETFANEDELDAAYEAEMAKRDDIASRIRSVIDIIPKHVRHTISKNIEKSMQSSVGFLPSSSLVFGSESDNAEDSLSTAEDTSTLPLKPSEMVSRSINPSRRTIIRQMSSPERMESPTNRSTRIVSHQPINDTPEQQTSAFQSLTTLDTDKDATQCITDTKEAEHSPTASSPVLPMTSAAGATEVQPIVPRRTVRQSFRKSLRLSRRLTKSVSRMDSLQPTLEGPEEEAEEDIDIIEYKYRELAAAKLYNARYENFQVGVTNLIETVQPYIRLRLTLRAVAICVLFTVRFRRAVDGSEIKYHLLGALGRRHQINSIEVANKRLQEEVACLKKNNTELVGNIDHLKKRIEFLKQQKKDVEQRLAIRERDFMQSKLVKVTYNEEYNELKLDLLRQRIISQAQRSLADRLAAVVHAVRQRIYLLLHGMDNRVVSALSMLGQGGIQKQETIDFTDIEDSMEMTKKKRMRHLHKKFKHAFVDVVEWIRSHRHERPIRPFHIKAYGDFNVFGSRLRNEEKVIGHCSRLVMSEIAQLEAKFGYKMSLLSEMEASMKQMQEDFQMQVDARMKELDVERAQLEKQRREGLQQKPPAIVTTSYDSVPAPKLSPVPALPLQTVASHRSSPSLPQSSHRQESHDPSARTARTPHEREDDALQKQYDELIVDYEFLRRQNIVLRTAVSDSYRVQMFDNDDKERQRIEHEKQQRELARKLRMERIQHRGVQVSCAVCTIREHGTMQTEDAENDVILIPRASSYLRRMEQLEISEAALGSGRKSPRRPVSAQLRNSSSEPQNKFARMKNIPKKSPRVMDDRNFVKMAAYLQYDSNVQDTMLPTERRQTAQYVHKVTFNQKVNFDGTAARSTSPTLQGWMT